MGTPSTYSGNCPYCSGAFTLMRFSSHYIGDVRLWSDGYQESEGWTNLGRDAWRSCLNCKRLICLSDVNLCYVERFKPLRRPFLAALSPSFKKREADYRNQAHAKRVALGASADNIDINSIRLELDTQHLTKETEYCLRSMAWRLWPRSEQADKPEQSWHVDNTEKLISLTEVTSETTVFVKTELLRQLHRFDEAIHVLHDGVDIITEKNGYITLQLFQACLEGKADIFEIDQLELDD